MKTSLASVFLCAALALGAFTAAGQPKKYDIKSGIVTYEVKTSMGDIKMTMKTVVYFDDYGMLECKDTYTNDVLKESYFSDGKNLYAVHYSNKTAFNRGSAYRGTEYRYDWDEALRSKEKVRRLPNISIAGKNCEAFELVSKTGTTVYAGWNHICLMIDVKGSTVQVATKAVKIEEGAKIPAEKFKVPAGFKLQ